MTPYWHEQVKAWEKAGRPEKKRWALSHGLPQHTFRRVTNEARTIPIADISQEHTIPIVDPDKPPSWEEGPDWAAAASESDTIKNPEQLIAAAGIDMRLWKIDHHQVKTYQGYRRDEFKDLTFADGKISGRVYDEGNIRLVTMWSVKVWFVRREEAPYENALEGLLKSLRRDAPRIAIPSARVRGDHLLLPVFTDIHFGRLTMDGRYTPERTRLEMIDAGAEMISRVMAMGIKFDRVLFPIGNDFLNVDNLNNTTTRGTWQEMSGGVRDAASEAVEAHIALVGMLAEVAPVDVVIIEGNHDRFASFWLGQVLDAYYHRTKRVAVDITHGPRNYRRYGKNLIGMEHGDRVKPEKLALTMAQEAPEMWAATKYRTFLRGHFHVEREQMHMVNGTGAVQIVTFPAFCPPDEWERVMGYLGTHRAAEARLFHLEHGPAGQFPVFIDELPKRGAPIRKREAVAAAPAK